MNYLCKMDKFCNANEFFCGVCAGRTAKTAEEQTVAFVLFGLATLHGLNQAWCIYGSRTRGL